MYPPRVIGTGPKPYLMQAADGGDTIQWQHCLYHVIYEMWER